MKFGLKFEPWDQEAETGEELQTILRCAATNNMKQLFYVVMIVNPLRYHIVVEALQATGFHDIQKLTWCKADAQMLHGAVSRFTEADETIVVARYGTRPRQDDGRVNFPNDPTERMTWFIGKTQKTKLHLGTAGAEGKVCNPYEKPPWLSYHLASFLTQPGDQAMVFGTGAGGDVKGLLNLGLHVTAFENDETQVPSVAASIMAFASKTETYKPMRMHDIKTLMKRDATYQRHDELIRESGEMKCPIAEVVMAEKRARKEARAAQDQQDALRARAAEAVTPAMYQALQVTQVSAMAAFESAQTSPESKPKSGDSEIDFLN